jgi:hypothetical protein
MLALLAFVWQRVQTPWWDLTPDVKVLLNAVQDGDGYEGTDEYVPIAADPYEIHQTASKATLDGPGRAQIRLQEWTAESKRFGAQASEPTRLAVRLFNYPAWRVEVNGRAVATETRQATGQMIVPVPAGENEVRITFVRTWDRVAGDVISVLTLLIGALGFFIGNARRCLRPTCRLRFKALGAKKWFG